MDALYLLMGGICLAEAAGLFAGRDFFMFTGNVKKEDFDLGKVYSVERWIFAADAACCLGVGSSRLPAELEWALLALFGATLFVHGYVFKSKKFRREK
ncbi:MAG: hypothetical protein LIP16_09350 [Clostridium sp.]|nr:hypothetical protein [Clostridium sp.]